MVILVINAGSSTLKFAVLQVRDALWDSPADGEVDWKGGGGRASVKMFCRDAEGFDGDAGGATYDSAVRTVVGLLREKGVVTAAEPVAAVGHRVVHGGTEFVQSVRIDGKVKEAIARMSELAPLHNPPALEAISAAEEVLPGVPGVAVFDTAFHATMPPEAYLYPVPYPWYRDWGVRKFGFHGISHMYCTRAAANILGRPLDTLNAVICHLGNGCSVTAVRDGKSAATTMGFTPLEGLMMGTRSGSIDPGVVCHVQRRHGLSAEQAERALNHESGLLGVSGTSSDYREVEKAAAKGNKRAGLALAMFADRVRQAVGAYAVTLGRVDALVFTAGIGEHSAALREQVCRGLEILGLKLDAGRNREGVAPGKAHADVAAHDSRGRILVVHTDEELMIAKEVERVVGG